MRSEVAGKINSKHLSNLSFLGNIPCEVDHEYYYRLMNLISTVRMWSSAL